MVVVTKKKGESDDRLIARFRKKVIFEGILEDFRERSRHKTASEKRKTGLPIKENWRRSEVINLTLLQTACGAVL